MENHLTPGERDHLEGHSCPLEPASTQYRANVERYTKAY